MRRLPGLVLWLAFPLATWAADGADKPLLVLDTGGHTATVWKVLFTPDGKELITVSDDKTIRFWDVTCGESSRVLRPPIGKGEEGMLYAAALSADGKLLAAGGFGPKGADSPIFLINPVTGQIDRVLKGHTGVIDALAFSRDGRRLASGSGDHTARLWNVQTGESEHTLTGHTKPISAVAFSPDGRHLATASYDNTARLWSVAAGTSEAELRGHEKEIDCIAWSPDGRTVATGSDDHSIRLWEAGGAFRKRFDKLGSAITAVVFTADSRRLLFTRGKGESKTCSLLDLASGEERVRFPGHNNTVVDGILAPGGLLAATTGGNDNETYVWQTADTSPAVRLAGKGRTVWSAGWSRDGSGVAWGNTNPGPNAQAFGPLEHSFRLADLQFGAVPDGTFRRAQLSRPSLSLEAAGPAAVTVQRGNQKVAELQLGVDYNRVRCFTLLGDDQAAVGSNFGLYLFDTRSGKQVRALQGHTGTVWALAPSPDNRYLLSASEDQTLRIWALDRGEPLLSLFVAGNDWVAWTPEGYYAASPGGEGLIGWQVSNGSDKMATFHPAERFRKSLYRPDVIKQLLTAGTVERAVAEADRQRNKPSESLTVAEALPPHVAITSPECGGPPLANAEIEVKATAKGTDKYPVTTLRLLLDGRPSGEPRGVKNGGDRGREVRESWTVQLTCGKHRLAVQAENAASKALSDEVEVDYQPERAELPTLYVLAIGVSAYPGKLKLDYAAKDAQDLKRALEARSGPLFRRMEVKLLIDEQATHKSILGALDWFKGRMTHGDVGIVTFSGHGARDNGGRFFLAPVDVDPANLPLRGVEGELFKGMLTSVPGRILVLLDACHSGSVDESKGKALSGMCDDLVRDLAMAECGVIVMCSSLGREVSLEDADQGHGYFTQALLEGLGGKADVNKDGVVYLNELDNYVTARVKELSKGQQHPITAKPANIRSFPLSKP